MQLDNIETPRPNFSTKVDGVSADDCSQMLQIAPEELIKLCQEFRIEPRTVRKSSGPTLYFDEMQMRALMMARGHEYPRRAQRISMMMCKGGVGKTTVSFYLGQRLAQYGARVLLIDTDPQGNLTAALCRTYNVYDISESTPVIMDVLSKRCTIEHACRKLTPNLHMIPSTALNSLLDKKLSGLSDNAAISVFELHRNLSLIDTQYDYIIIDSAPALSLVNASIMYASDRILLPLLMYEFSLMGLEQTLNEISDLQKTFKFTTQVNVLVNKFNQREKISLGYLGSLAEDYRPLVLKSVIRSSLHLQYAIATGRSLFATKRSNAKSDFDFLTSELLNLKWREIT